MGVDLDDDDSDDVERDGVVEDMQALLTARNGWEGLVEMSFFAAVRENILNVAVVIFWDARL